MKKIFNILLCCVAVAFVASCSDDNDNPYAHTSSVNITKADVFFDAVAADGGIIEFEANGNVSVVSSAQWCKADLNGKTVNVSVDQNDSRYSRAAVVTLRCNGDSATVSVVQKGVTMRLSTDKVVVSTDEATSASCEVVSNIPLEVDSKPEWVNVSFADGKLTVNFDENNTGTFRKGMVILRSENFTDSIMVGQYDFEKDIKGTYKLTYYRDAEHSSTRTFNATVKDDAMFVSSMNLNIPFVFDESTMSIVLQSGSYVGRSGSNYLYTIFADNELYYWTEFYVGAELGAKLEHDADGNIVAAFAASLGGINYSTIVLGKFTSSTFDASYYAGVYTTMYAPVLTRTLN